jgi:hypothetical protein
MTAYRAMATRAKVVEKTPWKRLSRMFSRQKRHRFALPSRQMQSPGFGIVG